MIFKFYMLIFILTLNFNLAFTQSYRYIPDSSKMIISFNINSIASNLNKSYAEIVDDIIENKTSYRIIEKIGISKLINSFTFNENIRIIFKDKNEGVGFIIPYKQDYIDIALIIKQLISEKDYHYIEISEKVAVGFKNNLLCISYSNYPDRYLEEIIKNNYPIRNEALYELDRKVNDISLWADVDYLLSFLDKNNEDYNEYNIYNYNPSITASLKDFRKWKYSEAYYYTPGNSKIDIIDLIRILKYFIPFMD